MLIAAAEKACWRATCVLSPQPFQLVAGAVRARRARDTQLVSVFSFEGGCRHLTADRLEITGSCWGLARAEVLLKHLDYLSPYERAAPKFNELDALDQTVSVPLAEFAGQL